jgi:hypothetical protein
MARFIPMRATPTLALWAALVPKGGTLRACGPIVTHPEARCWFVMGCSNINIPWQTYGLTDADYMHAFQRVVMPIAHEFNPDLVFGPSPAPVPSLRLMHPRDKHEHEHMCVCV